MEPTDRVRAIETGGCPHAAIREDISSNLEALEKLQAKYACELLFVESGGDNLAASYSSELADLHVYVIDVAGGDKVTYESSPFFFLLTWLIVPASITGSTKGRSRDFTIRHSRHQQD